MNQTLDSLFNYYQTAMSLRSHRQEVLASNISNADTPGYKARDFNFGQALTTALNGNATAAAANAGAVGDGSVFSANGTSLAGQGAALDASGLTHTAAGHLGTSSSLDPVGHALVQSAAQLKYRPSVQDSVDGNTVDMDVERAAFAGNAMHYEANITQLSGEIKNLIAAMQSA